MFQTEIYSGAGLDTIDKILTDIADNWLQMSFEAVVDNRLSRTLAIDNERGLIYCDEEVRAWLNNLLAPKGFYCEMNAASFNITPIIK